ncbi:MAG: MFS transporter, partial [Caulobacterales bacterium]|nr:MFS transporter [Caulobacterales bacterium]
QGVKLPLQRTLMDARDTPRWTPYSRYLIAILTIVYTFNFIDRQIIAILSPAIKADLGLSDTQLGFLKGFAFALFYATLGLPIARLADRRNRVTIIAAALALWSAMTALCGLAANFVQRAAARIGVGAGEAGCTPPAPSLIADYVPREQRATAIAIYSLGIPFGTVFGFLAGGWIASELNWRWAFVLVGLPGVALAVLVKATIREPERGAADAPSRRAAPSTDGKGDGGVPVAEAVRILWSNQSYRALSYVGALATFASFALSMWIVDFLFRTHALQYRDITLQLALIIGVGGALGTFAGGLAADRLARTGPGAYMAVPACAMLAATPFFAFAVWAPSPALCLAAFFPVFLLTNTLAGPMFGLVQNLAPLRVRAFAAAFFLFILNAFGFGFGPLAIGMASDGLAGHVGEAAALRLALNLLIPVWLLAAFILWRGRAQLIRDLREGSLSAVHA